MPSSEPNGHFNGNVYRNRHYIGDQGDQNWISFRAITKAGDERIFQGKVHLIEPQGISVISDIDDTIKISNVQDKEALLKNTFFKEFSPVSGMADIYRAWQQDGAVFHYLSASPWQLYPALSSFIAASGFPDGSYNLKNFRMKDETFFNLFSSQEEYKKPIVENLLKKYPGRRFILVGDAGEEDPEIFANAARQYPQQVLHIFIRDLNPDEVQSDRYKTTFRGIPKERWTLFGEGSDLSNFVIPAKTVTKKKSKRRGF
jgi:phosphatidate phosphatase APP1